jgi:exopolyphosphatase / guanosine-5'-triphosphate,3'-diphosphate pyrophosphatase
MRRVAAFDCGTNTLKVLVADLDRETGTQHELLRDLRMVRLGQDVDRTGVLSADALARTFGAIDEFLPAIEQYGVESARFCATSAARDADNAEEFQSGVLERLGVPAEVLSGDEEAKLSYDGATRGIPERTDPTLVLDIGGGSTEFVLDGRHASLNIGSVRMTERFLQSDPPTPHEIEAAAAATDRQLEALAKSAVFLDLAHTVIGVAGTVTTMAAMALDLPAYDRTVIHGSRIPRDAVRAMTGRLLEMTVAERRELPFMHPGRADVIGAGALILDRIVELTTVSELRVSESDILDGIAWSLV